jgi:hypothetical protein
MARFTFTAKVWVWDGPAAWHFAGVDPEVAEKIRKEREHLPRIGWGSVPVTVAIGDTSWKTSIFPDKKSGTYLLPVKAEVRKKEGIAGGDTVSITLDV